MVLFMGFSNDDLLTLGVLLCCSTADVNFEETLNTLKYANRARNIKNKPIINRDPQQALLAQMRSEIQVSFAQHEIGSLCFMFEQLSTLAANLRSPLADLRFQSVFSETETLSALNLTL